MLDGSAESQPSSATLNVAEAAPPEADQSQVMGIDEISARVAPRPVGHQDMCEGESAPGREPPQSLVRSWKGIVEASLKAAVNDVPVETAMLE